MIEELLFKKRMAGRVSYRRFEDDTMKREQIVKKFNTDPTIDVLLLTVKAGGHGITLTGADTVIMFEHDWNPNNDLQAMDRAHRLGQKRVVNVYRLITRGTMEERIMSLQKFKLHMAQKVVNEENASVNRLDADAFANAHGPAAAVAEGDHEGENDEEIAEALKFAN